MVIARGEFINELEKNMEFRQRYAERNRLKREKEEAAKRFMEEYNRIVADAAKDTEIAIDKKLTEMGLKTAGDIDELKFQVIYEMPSRYGVVTNKSRQKRRGNTYIQLCQVNERCHAGIGSEIRTPRMATYVQTYQR